MGKLSKNILSEEEIELMENKKMTVEHVRKQCVLNGRTEEQKYPAQIRFLTLTIGQAKTKEEEYACYDKIADIINGDEDTWIGLQKLRIEVNGSNMARIIPEIPPLKYDNTIDGSHAVINKNTNEIALPFIMREIFSLAKLFNNGWNVHQVNNAYNVNGFYQFYHQGLINLDYLKRFEEYFSKGALNGIIDKGFYFAKEKGGFLDTGIEKIIFTNEKIEDYLPNRRINNASF